MKMPPLIKLLCLFLSLKLVVEHLKYDLTFTTKLMCYIQKKIFLEKKPMKVEFRVG
jgi:hypothetical protein